MKERDGQDVERTERESKKRDFLIEAIVERVPELAFPCNQTDDYLNRHHRTFIQQLMEPDAEIHGQHWTKLPESSQREGGAIMSKKVRTMMGYPQKHLT